MSNNKVTVHEQIDAPPEQVYRAFATSQGMLEWLADAGAADGREGGRFYGWWNAGFYAGGLFKKVEENRAAVFSWQSPLEPAATEVAVTLAEADGGTAVTLVHSGLGDGDVWEQAARNFETEWKNSLANLKSVLETGVDKRLYDRPMLGFFIGGLVDENLQKRLNLPVDYGMHVAGLVDGMGAQRSGLLADDVITEVDGVEVRTYQSLAPMFAQHKGGDVVKTIVYRGPERIELDVELSKRPVPEFPLPPAELAILGRIVYKEVLKSLKSALKGASEKEASRRPGPGEWSAKQTMAHLLVTERWNQFSWDLHPAGGKLPAFPGSSHLVEAIARTYTAKRLYKELKASVEINMSMIEHLPEAYAANKGAYFLAASNFEQGIRNHFQEHVDQVRAALAAVKESGK